MKSTLRILMTGHGETNMETLRGLVSQFPGVEVQSRLLTGPSQDLLGIDASQIDLLILFLGAKPERELEALLRMPPASRPTTVVVHDQGTAGAPLMRLAMQAGARDFIMGAQAVDDAMAAVRKILNEDLANRSSNHRSLTAVVNAKGGAGGSTLASLLAHALAVRQNLRTLLLDLDFQFGSQYLRLDLHPEQGLMEALSAVESLDEIALMGYVAKHGSGLHVLGTLTSQVMLPGEINESRLTRLLEIIQQTYQHRVVDLPRLIDPVFNLILDKAEQVVVVLQQDLASLRDAQRLNQIMTEDLGLPSGRVRPVVNRYDRNNALSLADIERALGTESVWVIPNDFKPLQTASNLGLPVAEYAPRSPVNKAIARLAETLAGGEQPNRHGPWHQWLAKIFARS